MTLETGSQGSYDRGSSPAPAPGNPVPFTWKNGGHSLVMQESDGTVEVFRRQFRNGDPAEPLRHGTCDALHQVFPGAVDAGWMDDVLIVVSELVQNVSQHTHGPGEVVIALGPATVFIEVGDLDTTYPQCRRPALDRAGGRGLLLVEAISQRWGVRTCLKGKAVWAWLPSTLRTPHLSAA